MLNKSIRLTKGDILGLNEIISQDPRIEKGQSEALYYSFKDAATNIPNWSEVAKTEFEGDIDIDIDPEDISLIRTFSVEIEDFDTVRKSINEQLGMSRPRISYMTRLCIQAARVRLRNKKNIDQLQTTITDIKVIEIDGVSLIRRIAELLEDGSTEKLIKIKKILED